MALPTVQRRHDVSERLGGLGARLTLAVRRFRWAVSMYGPTQAVMRIPAALRRGRTPDEGWQSFIRDEDGDFDVRYGVDTGGLVYLRDLKVVGEHWTDGVDYQAVGAERFSDMLSRLPIEHEHYAFVDLGCGKGRALIMAAGYPFRAVAGVEYSEDLATTARENLEVFKGPRNAGSLEVVHADAAEYELPGAPLVVFLYNPFGASVMEKVIAKIEAAARGNRLPSYVIYYNPRVRHLFRPDAFEVVDHVDSGDGYVIYRCPGASHA